MGWQPARLTRAQMEERRLAAVRLLRAGRVTQAEIARQLGVSRAAVTHWHHRLAEAGSAGLHRRPAPGRRPRLSDAQWEHLLGELRQGAVAAGFDTERWTLPRIAHVVE